LYISISLYEPKKCKFEGKRVLELLHFNGKWMIIFSGEVGEQKMSLFQTFFFLDEKIF
jgi:hypothetical protein